MAPVQFSKAVARKTVNHDTAFVQVQHRRDEDAGKHLFEYVAGGSYDAADFSAAATGGGADYTTGMSASFPQLPTNARVMAVYHEVTEAFVSSGTGWFRGVYLGDTCVIPSAAGGHLTGTVSAAGITTSSTGGLPKLFTSLETPKVYMNANGGETWVTGMGNLYIKVLSYAEKP